ncbi:MAG: hypothetical protein IT162_03075 [Bryobacterales bacterium]|nr:hypothetical protein [Bryobacterales bacterium]
MKLAHPPKSRLGPPDSGKRKEPFLMRSSTWILVQMSGLCLLRAQTVPTQAIVPQQPAPSSAQRNPFEAVPEPPKASPSKSAGPAIRAIEFRGANRILQSALRAVILSRAGDAYDVETLQVDSQALYNTRRFSHVVWEAEPGPEGAVVRFVVIERPLIEALEYQGGNTMTIQEIVERLNQRQVNLRVETLFDENELPRAVAAVQELVAEKGLRNFTVTPLVERLGPPSIAKITFRVQQR